MQRYNNTRSSQPNTTRRDGALSISVVDDGVSETKFLNSDFLELQKALQTQGAQALQELTNSGMLNFHIPTGVTAEQTVNALKSMLKGVGARFGVLTSEKNAGKDHLISQNGTFVKFFVTSDAKEQRKADVMALVMANQQ